MIRAKDSIIHPYMCQRVEDIEGGVRFFTRYNSIGFRVVEGGRWYVQRVTDLPLEEPESTSSEADNGNEEKSDLSKSDNEKESHPNEERNNQTNMYVLSLSIIFIGLRKKKADKANMVNDENSDSGSFDL